MPANKPPLKNTQKSPKPWWPRFKKWLRWVSFGPDEDTDKATFEASWAKAELLKGRAAQAAQQALSQQIQHEYDQRMASLRTVAQDAGMLLQHIGLVVLVVGVVFQEQIQVLMHSSARHFIWVLAASWYWLANSHTPRFFYTFFTHFIGTGERAKDILSEKKRVNLLRKDTNSRSRTLQKARRRLGLGKCMIFALVFCICVYVSFRK